ncbi:ribonuclease R [Chitinimonas sp.]|uniref:ribonuclease R n=1 Tax=Chitinimonas sp. TaxID=1934313 RepID=UPI0039C87D02
MKTKKNQTMDKLPRAAQKLREADPFYQQELTKYEHPLPSRSYMLKILTDHGAPMFPDELAALFAIRPHEADFFSRRINAMAREGEVIINRKGAICIPDKLDLIKARVQGHADGFGFAVPDDGSPDLFLGPKEMHKVLHRDRVMVRQIGVDRRGRREGKIVEVLEHVNNRLVGRLFAERGVRFVRAEERRITQEILISPEGGLPAEPGQVVSVELVTQPSNYSQPIGRIIEVLGNYADPGMEIEIALRKHDLPHEFSHAAETQAAKTPQKVRKQDWKTPEGLKRVDLRDMPLVTIDGETARDFDDAVYAEKDGKGWRLVVAIADVSHYVRPGDALDQTGYERGNSVYFPRRVIPMLPEALSNGICSLNPDVERCCMVCDIKVGPGGKLKKYQFYPAVMLSKARLTYTEAWEILQNPKGKAAKARNKGLVGHLQDLYALFQVLLKARGERGAIDFETTETQMVFNEAGKIERIVPVSRNDAHRLIEECMLAANVCAADYLGRNKHTSLYRIHEGPTERKLENLRRFLNEHGLTLEGGDEPHAKDYAKVMEQIKGRPDVGLLQTMLLRSMQQAVYSPEQAGHFGLAYEAYTHFTSPIRRYPDLLVHRSIKAVLKGEKYKPGKWEEIGAHCSQTERRADEATRDVENWLKCYFMRDRIGEVFEGSISAVTSFGLFVSLDQLFVEGLVHISELGTDYFKYDEASHSLRGEHSGKVYGLTDRLTIKVARVDLETSKIDFVLLAQGKSDAKPARSKAKVATSAPQTPPPSVVTPVRPGRGSQATEQPRGQPKTQAKAKGQNAPKAAAITAPAVTKPVAKRPAKQGVAAPAAPSAPAVVQPTGSVVPKRPRGKRSTAVPAAILTSPAPAKATQAAKPVAEASRLSQVAALAEAAVAPAPKPGKRKTQVPALFLPKVGAPAEQPAAKAVAEPAVPTATPKSAQPEAAVPATAKRSRRKPSQAKQTAVTGKPAGKANKPVEG